MGDEARRGAPAMGDGPAGWGFVAPALLWTVAFFLLPFSVMAAMSLARLEGRELVWGLDWGNYARLAEPTLRIR